MHVVHYGTYSMIERWVEWPSGRDQWLAFCLLFSALAGCASPSGSGARVEPLPNAACCTTFEEMNYSTLKPDAETSLDLRKGSPVYSFDEGRSYFASFDLPASSGPRKLVFKTFMGGTILPFATVVRPYFLFLDEGHSPIGKVQDPPVFSGSDFFRGVFFKGEVEVPPEAKHVIIYTSDKPVTPWTVYSENGIAWPAKPSMTGNLLIKVSNP